MPEQQIFNALIEFFEEDGWEFQWIPDTSILSMGFSGENGKWLCYAQARESEAQLVFYSVLSVNVPLDKRHKVSEFITRVNYGMVIGNFEMDYDDGEVRYKTSVDLEGSEPGAAMIRQIVYANLIITDRYLPGVMKVIYSDDSPVDVLDGIELEDLLNGDLEDLATMFFEDDGDDFDDDDFIDDDDFPSIDLPPGIDSGSPN